MQVRSVGDKIRCTGVARGTRDEHGVSSRHRSWWWLYVRWCGWRGCWSWRWFRLRCRWLNSWRGCVDDTDSGASGPVAHADCGRAAARGAIPIPPVHSRCVRGACGAASVLLCERAIHRAVLRHVLSCAHSRLACLCVTAADVLRARGGVRCATCDCTTALDVLALRCTRCVHPLLSHSHALTEYSQMADPRGRRFGRRRFRGQHGVRRRPQQRPGSERVRAVQSSPGCDGPRPCQADSVASVRGRFEHGFRSRHGTAPAQPRCGRQVLERAAGKRGAVSAGLGLSWARRADAGSVVV